MFKKVFLLFAWVLVVHVKIAAQDTAYAREVISALCSPEMAGRGYVNDGDAAAADYIKKQFEKLGLEAFDFNYYQDFSFPVNTFPGRVNLLVDGVKMKPGVDFIINPKSSTYKGKFDVLTLDSLAWDSLMRNPVVQDGMMGFSKLPVSNSREFNQKAEELSQKIFPAMLWRKERLTWSVATATDQSLEIDIVDSCLKTPPKLVEIDFETKFKKVHRTQNVVSYVRGTAQPDSFLVFTAHYDHLGIMGKEALFPGANDNASGVSMLLQLAKYFEANKAGYSIAFIAFAGEEAGLKGSEFYVRHPIFPLMQIKCLVNLDLLGTGEEGITVVNATEFPKLFAKMEKINIEKEYVTQVKKRGKAANSDHHHFTEKGVPSFFIYTLGGIKAYHDVFDKPETLPLTEYADVFRLIRDFALRVMGI